jgi:3-oxoacyl-[acyl-carrier-protein] synthase II
MPLRRAVVTSFGLVTPLGNNPDDIWSELIKGHSAAKNWKDLEDEGFRFSKACRITDSTEISPLTRGASFAREALRNAINEGYPEFTGNTGIFIGSTIGESGAFEAIAGRENLDPLKYTAESFAGMIKRDFGLNGFSFSYGTACTAGNYALGAAAAAIRNGLTDVAIAGGIEPFSRVAMTGFSRLRAMTSGQCRPFDKDRDGMILGEGAAVFILEDEEYAIDRNVKPLAVIGSLGLSCDAYHSTAPLADGSGVIRAIKSALMHEQIEPGVVDWICAHGSGTVISDRAEALAIRDIFGANVPVTGVKGALGHALGAATAIEAAICIIALQKNEFPPTVNLQIPDPEFEIDLVSEARKKELNYVLNCGYAFGGLNSALLIRKWR